MIRRVSNIYDEWCFELLTINAQKMKLFIKDIFSKCD